MPTGQTAVAKSPTEDCSPSFRYFPVRSYGTLLRTVYTTPTADPSRRVHIRQGVRYPSTTRHRLSGSLSIRPFIVDHLDVRGRGSEKFPAYGSSHFHAIQNQLVTYSTRSLRELRQLLSHFNLVPLPSLPPSPTTVLS